MQQLSFRIRAQLRRLVRRHGLRLVAEVFGMSPGNVARLVAGERCQEGTRRAIEFAFEELGLDLGLDLGLACQQREPSGAGVLLEVIRGGRVEEPH